MVKPRVTPIIGLFVVCLATLFVWLGKTPSPAPDAFDPYLSPPPTDQPADTEQAGDPVGVNVQGESDASDGSAPDDSQGDPSGAMDGQPDLLPDILPLITGPLELPVEGASGWAAVAMPLYSEADTDSAVVVDLDDGQVFVIIEEQGDWWYVRCDDGESGWVEHVGCLINLPDVLPSIVYDITNAYCALTRSSGYEIPGVTGQKLYDAFSFNPRFQRDEFIVPTLYATSKLLFYAQRLALESGDTLVVYEAYRAHASQQRSVSLLKELIESNEAVDRAINDGPWNLNWFIATTMSNHQRAVAFDASLGKVLSYEVVQFGQEFFLDITEYEEYRMPTAIHELSPLAATLVRPASSSSRDAWRDVPLSDTMTRGAISLQNYFVDAGFTPLASEWWHFNDLSGVEVANEVGIEGSFFVGDIMSVGP